MNSYTRALSVEGVTNQLDSIICMKGYSMYYEPAITVDTSNLFNPDNYNQEGAAWGWLNKNTNIGYYQSSDITNRGNIQLRKANFNGNTTILSNVYPKNALFNHDDFNGKVFFNQRNNYNTKRWYLSVNLKSKEAINLLNFEKIALTIRLPYKYYDANGVSHDDFIEFTQIPATNVGNLSLDTIHIRGTRGDFRGYGRRESIVSPTDKFEIKGKMLALSNTLGNDSSITLSAFFEFNPDDVNKFPLIQKYQTIPYKKCTYQIDVEVEYNDEIDIDLNWVKLETPHARDLFRGVWDNRIATLLNTYISRYDTPDSNVNNLRINRFYGDDEIEKDLWYGNRYFNMLVDTLANLETGVDHNRPAQFLHATGFKEFWNGANIKFHQQISAPYFRQGSPDNSSVSTFGLVDGYAGRSGDTFGIESIKFSNYETKVTNGYVNSFNNESYENLLRYQITVQGSIESSFIGYYVNNKSLLFSKKPWHAWIWPQSETWGYNSTFDAIYNTKFRPKTGEEINLMTKIPVFLGAKGVFYWLKTKIYDVYHSSDEGPGSLLGLQPSDDINYIDNLPQNITQFDQQSMNLDYFNFTYDDNYYRWNDAYNPTSYNFNLMNVSQNRVYMGLQTMRYELKKVNEWLENNSNFLMSLNLIAWYGKGHTTIQLGNYNKDFNDNIIWRFIDIHSIKTRPLDRVENGLPLYEQSYSIDSGFYDIMIHKNGSTSLDNEFTMAVINRRTDPLIYDEDDEEFYFISTHEFDNLTLDTAGNQKRNPITNVMKSTDYWRTKYWQKQGCREIRVRLNYHRENDEFFTTLLKVNEITTDNTFDNNWPWWRKDNSPLPENTIYSLEIDTSGNVWIATEKGLVKFDGQNWTIYNTSNSKIPSNVIISLDLDIKGDLWVATADKGLTKFDGTTFTNFNTTNSGLPSDIIRTIKFDNNNVLWIGAGLEGLVKYDGKNWTVFNQTNSALPGKSVRVINVDKSNSLWMGIYVGGLYYGAGLVKFDGTNMTVFNKTNSQIKGNEIEAIGIDKSDNIWLGVSDDDNDNTGVMIFNEKGIVLSKVNDNYDIDNINIYPIPASESLKIDNEDLINKDYYIYDILGQTVQTGKFYNNINISNLINGIYYLKIGNKFLKRFIRN